MDRLFLILSPISDYEASSMAEFLLEEPDEALLSVFLNSKTLEVRKGAFEWFCELSFCDFAA